MCVHRTERLNMLCVHRMETSVFLISYCCGKYLSSLKEERLILLFNFRYFMVVGPIAFDMKLNFITGSWRIYDGRGSSPHSS